MPIRPLLLVAALAGGDYLLWTWSSDGGSTTIALISGLALAPLILGLIWLVSVGVARTLIARAGSPQASAASAKKRPRRRGLLARLSRSRRHATASGSSADLCEQEDRTARAPGRQAPSQKIAA